MRVQRVTGKDRLLFGKRERRALRLVVRTLFAASVLCALSLAPAFAQRGGPASVFAETVRAGTFANRIEAIGTLAPNERVDLTLNAADRVTAIYFEDGERVRKGKTLLSLAQREQLAMVEGAEAEAEQARQQLDRLEPLADDGAVSQSELDIARRNAASAEAQLRAVQSRQNDRVLVAPFDGVLGFRQVSIGTYIRPGDVVATLIDDSVMKLDFAVPSSFLRALRPGLDVAATSGDLPGLSFSGTVATIDNVIDPVTRSVRVRALVANTGGLLKAGMFINVTLLAEPREALSVPEEALQPVGPRTFIWIVASGEKGTVARRAEVTPGLRQDGRVEIVAGLKAGDRVITDGAIRVRQGSPVIIRDRSLLTPGGAGGSGPTAGASPGGK